MVVPHIDGITGQLSLRYLAMHDRPLHALGTVASGSVPPTPAAPPGQVGQHRSTKERSVVQLAVRAGGGWGDAAYPRMSRPAGEVRCRRRGHERPSAREARLRAERRACSFRVGCLSASSPRIGRRRRRLAWASRSWRAATLPDRGVVMVVIMPCDVLAARRLYQAARDDLVAGSSCSDPAGLFLVRPKRRAVARRRNREHPGAHIVRHSRRLVTRRGGSRIGDRRRCGAPRGGRSSAGV
jgi:hypothetical protein